MIKKRMSIAMCTYNGARFLQQQLNSIAYQTLLPDEIVVCDDGSTDDTLPILHGFKKVALFPVRIYCNTVRLGIPKNFEQAITLCSGDIITLSDQDDVWMPHKLERIEQVLDNQMEAGYVFSNALMIDEISHPLDSTMWKIVSFTPSQLTRFKKGRQIEILINHNVVTGATMAFRSEIRNLLLPIPEQWVHDAWIALIGSATGREGIFIEEPLICYRTHSGQVIGGSKAGFYEKIQSALSTKGETFGYTRTKYLQVLNQLHLAGFVNGDAQELIRAKIQHLETRQLIYKRSFSKRIRMLLKELISGRYHKFSDGWRSASKDLFVRMVR